jgi:hypothetical protein
MSTRLSATNPYLQDSAARARSVLRSVETSSAIEGIHAPFKPQRKAARKSTGSAKRKKRAKR